MTTYKVESASNIAPGIYEDEGEYFHTLQEAVDYAIKGCGSDWQIIKQELVFSSKDKEAIGDILGDAVWRARGNDQR